MCQRLAVSDKVEFEDVIKIGILIKIEANEQTINFYSMRGIILQLKSLLL